MLTKTEKREAINGPTGCGINCHDFQEINLLNKLGEPKLEQDIYALGN